MTVIDLINYFVRLNILTRVYVVILCMYKIVVLVVKSHIGLLYV